MRRLIITEFVSLDGVMQAPGGEPGYPHSGWVGGYFTPELGEYKEAEQQAADVLLLGRVTYESFYGAWPEREGSMADKINTMRKIVVSTTLGASDWHDTTVILGSGFRFYPETPERTELKLLEARTLDNGVGIQRWAVVTGRAE